ncbi:ABC transporter permease [Tumebacillus sp. ITR2]|uniref:ABC transporter permease n=1 Tax=Tumebacillus amylolyticus TaxID=2801339 RepID=A0ABS1J7U0_9BACL|nr:ABC transporter permease [Tumebacillus amylolyticus]
MRTWALCKRVVKQLGRDKRTIAMLFVAPLLVLSLLSVVMTNSATTSKIDAVNLPAPLVEQLKKTDATIHEVSLDSAKQDLNDLKADAYLEVRDGKPHLMLEGSDPVVNRAVLQALQEAQRSLSPNQQTPEISYLYGGSDLTQLDNLAPVLIGFFIFFFVFLLSGVAFLRERTAGTLERVLATPVRRYEIVLGYFLGFGIFAALQTLFVQWFALYVLDVRSVGNFGSVLLTNLLIATVALSLGTLLSAFARNEFQMVQFIPLVVVPQIFLSGMFDMRNFPDWVTALSNILPLTQGANVLRSLMLRGQGLADNGVSLWILAGYGVLFLTLNTIALKRYRRV